jgi:hypothetical protein
MSILDHGAAFADPAEEADYRVWLSEEYEPIEGGWLY